MWRANCVICALSTACAEGDQIGEFPAARLGALTLGFSLALVFTFAFFMAPLSPTPDAREPGLLFARQTGRPVVMLKLGEPGGLQELQPFFVIMISAIAPAIPAFLVIAMRIR